ncbi:MAG TPA: GGDEF domain-containing protein, partial [Solirubrobacterales bacterium]|nr:GGDEF domain-containing protein [Solirubrobacterales bacterium]
NGHAAGDRLLKSAASAWDGLLRSEDLITRMGGDEFVIVLPNCSMDVTTQIAARLREAVPDGQRCSLGISCWNGKDSAEEFLAAADKSLYETKAASNGTPAV